jgi:hypothetical protein
MSDGKVRLTMWLDGMVAGSKNLGTRHALL